MKTLSEWLAHCENLHPHAIDMGLDRVREVAQKLQLALKVPVITVAGTNGKGSTCAMIEAVCAVACKGSRRQQPCLQMLLSRLSKHGERSP